MTYWEYEYDGELSDGEYATKEKAQDAADAFWEEHCIDCMELSNGESAEEEIYLVEFEPRNNDESQEVSREKSWVCYEEYHGDYAEHNVWHKGGVL